MLSDEDFMHTDNKLIFLKSLQLINRMKCLCTPLTHLWDFNALELIFILSDKLLRCTNSSFVLSLFSLCVHRTEHIITGSCSSCKMLLMLHRFVSISDVCARSRETDQNLIQLELIFEYLLYFMAQMFRKGFIL